MTMTAEPGTPEPGTDGSGHVLLLPAAEGVTPLWWAVAAGTAQAVPPPRAPGRVVVLVPAALCPVRELPASTLPPAQALAAARLAGAPLGGAVHSAAAPGGDGRVLVAHAASADMTAWLAACEALGVVPAALVPAALALPRPENGVVVGELGGQALARTPEAAFAAEPELLRAFADDAPVQARAAEAGLAALFAAPPLDMRQGAFAPPRASVLAGLDWPVLARRAALCLLLALVLTGAWIVRWHRAATLAEASALQAVRAHGLVADDLPAAVVAVRAEQARRGVGAAGFAAPVAALLKALRAAPSCSLRDLVWTGDGVLHTTLAGPRVEDVNAVLIALGQAGWQVTVPPALAPDPTGATVAAITVSAP